jgi:hypothetical protein
LKENGDRRLKTEGKKPVRQKPPDWYKPPDFHS